MTETNSTNGALWHEESSRKAHKTGERPKIKFPNYALSEAVSLAKAVVDVGGSACGWDKLAKHMGFTATGGGFRQRAMDAKMFGLIEYQNKNVSLTKLGARICDSEQEESAKIDAFLAVPLYKAVYDQYSGTDLPRDPDLEAPISNMGVPHERAKRVCLVLRRSAEQAGFFRSGNDRLVKPPFATSGVAEEHKEDGGSQGAGGRDAKASDCRQHHFVEGLIELLPRIGEPWPIAKRMQWFQAAVSCLNLIYPDDESGGSIEVRLKEKLR